MVSSVRTQRRIYTIRIEIAADAFRANFWQFRRLTFETPELHILGRDKLSSQLNDEYAAFICASAPERKQNARRSAHCSV
jgi:hypothetical protein